VNRDDVIAARAEAQRFIERADALLATKVPHWNWHEKTSTSTVTQVPWNGSNGPAKEAAAVRRASLDLTRALAHMRRR
jgi:hypothetical protein